jgi:ABC-type transport system involved in multi-copper enzyme maturation permease subunit
MSALSQASPLPGPRLVRAEILKLRKRRGLAVTVLLQTVGAVVLTYAILAILHAANPAHHGPAGGVTNLGHVLWILSALGAAAAALAGSTTGAGDVGAGIFRELVITGRSRVALFLARIPGGLAFLLSAVGLAYAIAAASSVAFAGSLPAPSTGTLLAGGLWLVLATSVYFLIALGLSSLLSSRTTPIVIVLAWRLALAPILLSISLLGAGRQILPDAGIERFAPHAFKSDLVVGKGVGMSVVTAALVLAAWALVALGVGAWRTVTRDA